MIKVVDLVYHCHDEYDRPQQVLDKHNPTIGFIEFIHDRVGYEVVRHLNFEGKEIVNNVPYAFFKRNNAAWQIPFKTHKYIRSLKPDIVIIHGFIFPLQVIALKMSLGKNCIVVLQQHGDQPANSLRKIFQQTADRFVDAYLFTSAAIAGPWIEHKVIRNKNKVFELLEASAFIKKMDKASCKQKLGLAGNNNFLWVGRLNENKDPITILKAFSQHVSSDPSARLFMVYHTEELISKVKFFISGSSNLHKHVHLIGRLDKTTLADWYNAADFYISGSHEEAAGYALLEAMSVGCIPVVTSIPAFKKILNNGEAGFMFQPGNEKALAALLGELNDIDIEKYSNAVEKYFHKNLSFENIADNVVDLCKKLVLIKH